jgi:hypothetical protein
MSLLAATSAATVVAAVSAAAAVGTFLAYVYFVRREDLNAAREEALALAETRGQIISDLRARLDSVERERLEAEATLAKRIRELEEALSNAQNEAREQAYQMQRFYAAALVDLLSGVEHDLEADPPDVGQALGRVRSLLARRHPVV